MTDVLFILFLVIVITIHYGFLVCNIFGHRNNNILRISFILFLVIVITICYGSFVYVIFGHRTNNTLQIFCLRYFGSS
jgi:hypothetical protein